MSVQVNGNRIYLYGDVGFWGGEEYFTPSNVVRALREIGDDRDVLVSINSGGGSAFDGIAIYNALAGHAGQVNVEIDGIAASAGSVIAMAASFNYRAYARAPEKLKHATFSLAAQMKSTWERQRPPLDERTAAAFSLAGQARKLHGAKDR